MPNRHPAVVDLRRCTCNRPIPALAEPPPPSETSFQAEAPRARRRGRGGACGKHEKGKSLQTIADLYFSIEVNIRSTLREHADALRKHAEAALKNTVWDSPEDSGGCCTPVSPSLAPNLPINDIPVAVHSGQDEPRFHDLSPLLRTVETWTCKR